MDFAFRLEWLDEVKEEVIDPDRKIVDPHQHFFEGSEMFPSYSLEDYWEDLGTHRVEESVFVECEEHYRETGPELMAPLGETEWVDVHREAHRGRTGRCGPGAGHRGRREPVSG